MKSFIATILLAGAAIVSAQISALPPCGIVCGLQAANATSCVPVSDFNCTCQYANQAIILPILQTCLNATCDNAAQSAAAIAAGINICASVSQTASSMAAATSTAKMTSASTSSVPPMTTKSSSAASATSASSTKASATYTGAAAAMPTAGVQALMAVAGMAMLAL